MELIVDQEELVLSIEGFPLIFSNYVTGLETQSRDSIQTATLGEIADVIDCKHRTAKPSSEGVPIVSPGDIKWGPLELGACRLTSEAEYSELMGHCVVNEWDLVMGRNQAFGVAAFVLPGQRFVLGQDTVLIQGRKVTNKYLYLALHSPFLRSQIDTLSTGSTFKRINLRDIRSLLIPLPNDRMMALAVSFVDQQQTLENVARHQNEVLKALLRQLSIVIVSSNGQQP